MSHPALGFAPFDGANTVVTAGLNDFGFAGVTIYPILLVLVYALIARLLASRLPPFLFYLLAFRLIYMSLSVESALPSFLTVGLRDLAIITLLFLLIWKIPYRRATGLYYARRISQA